MSLLSAVRAPLGGWRNFLELASSLLTRGGYLLQYDERNREFAMPASWGLRGGVHRI